MIWFVLGFCYLALAMLVFRVYRGDQQVGKHRDMCIILSAMWLPILLGFLCMHLVIWQDSVMKKRALRSQTIDDLTKKEGTGITRSPNDQPTT